MICITINQESHQQALVDMCNAGRHCDLIEVRLDRFKDTPDIGNIIAARTKPLIMSCPRQQDGGWWEGTEKDRLAMLRQCIAGGADYVEIELDVADQIRKFPPTKRVIAYTNVKETPRHIGEIYQEALSKSPDAIKLAVTARTPEEAWPVVQVLGKAVVPTVVVGLGEQGMMLTTLGQKLGAASWSYAAFERGTESYPGQPTVWELNDTYHFPSINKATRLVGVTGFTEEDRATVAALNAALAACRLPARCLPLGMGNLGHFRKVVEALKLVAVVADKSQRRQLLDVATDPDPAAIANQKADVLLHRDGKWLAYDTQTKALVDTLEAAVRAKNPAGPPLDGRAAMVVGANDMALAMAQALKARGTTVFVASHDEAAGRRTAELAGVGFVPFDHGSARDVVVVCDEEKKQALVKTGLRGCDLSTGATVLDLTASMRPNQFVREAKTRGCGVVMPEELFLDEVMAQANLLTGKLVTRDVLRDALRHAVLRPAVRRPEPDPPVHCRCPRCGQKIDYRTSQAGQRTSCTDCGENFHLPPPTALGDTVVDNGDD